MERYIIYCVCLNGNYRVIVRAFSYADLQLQIMEIKGRDKTIVNIDAWHDFGDDIDD